MKRFLCITLTIVLALSMTACVGKAPAAQSSPAPVINLPADNASKETTDDVTFTAQPIETQNTYTDEDLSMVDTTTGKRVVLGMSIADVESITGNPIAIDQSIRIYDGIVVNYRDGVAAVLIVARSNMLKGSDAGRYVTTRGISLSTSIKDFNKTYATEKAETAEVNTSLTRSGATHYLKKDGDEIKYLGSTLNEEAMPEDLSSIYLQDFIFDSETDTISSIRIGDYNMIINGY